MKLTSEDVELIRHAHRASLEEFAARVDCAASTISRIESGIMSVSAKTSRKICQAYGVNEIKMMKIRWFFMDL
jgi:transcriptional regulator with XRE-family HTH domain